MPDRLEPAVLAAAKLPHVDLPGGGFDANGDWHDPGNGKFARRGFSSWKRLAMEAMEAWQVVREDAAHSDSPVMARVGTNGLSRGGLKKGDWIEISYVDALYGKVKASTSGRSYNVKWTHFDDVKVLPDVKSDVIPDTPDAPSAPATRDEIEAAVAAGTLRELNLVGADLSGIDLQDTDLSGMDLSRANLTGTLLDRSNLSGAKLTEADLTGAFMGRANLTGADIGNANLTEAQLYGANMSGINLFNADLTGAKLIDTDLTNAKFTYATLTGAKLNGANLTGADLYEADLSDIDLSNANLSNANLYDANLTEANLIEADLTGANLTHANLSFANLSKTSLTGADLTDSLLHGAFLDFANLTGANLTRANLNNAKLVRADLTGADLTRAVLTGAILGGANLSRVNLSDANLTGANLNRANLTGVNLDRTKLPGADLTGVDLSNLDLTGVNLTGASLYYTDLTDTNMTGADLTGAFLDDAVLTGTNLTGADLTRAVLRSANLTGANLTGADLIDANLTDADLSNTNLSGLDLRYTVLTGANLDGANIDGTIFREINITKENLGVAGIPSREDMERLDPEMLAWVEANDQSGFPYPGILARTPTRENVAKAMNDPNPDPALIRVLQMHVRAAEFYTREKPVSLYRGVSAGFKKSDPDQRSGILSWTTNQNTAEQYGEVVEIEAQPGTILAFDTLGNVTQLRDYQGGVPFDQRPPVGSEILVADNAEIIDRIKQGITPFRPPYVPVTRAEVEAAVAAGTLKDLDLVGADLSGMDLSGVDLFEVNLARADLTNTNLREADLRYATLTGATLRGANLTDANLSRASLSEADLAEANLTTADLSQTYLVGTNLRQANLTDADLSAANMNNVAMSNADLTGANLRDTQLTNVSLSDANLTGADLTNANLNSTNLTGATLTGAELTGVIWSDVDLTRANLRGVGLTDANLTGINLSEADLSDADLTGANLTEATLSRANLTNALLRKANLTDADFTNLASMSHDAPNANLTGANLSEANLTRTNLSFADLTDAKILSAKLTDANLSQANLTRANLIYSTLAGANLSSANLTDANLANATLTKADLARAGLSGADLTKADLSDAIMTNAILLEANLTNANLSYADLSDANLSNATLTGATLVSILDRANLTGADLTDANLEGAEMTGANLTGADLTGANLTDADLTDAIGVDANGNSIAVAVIPDPLRTREPRPNGLDNKSATGKRLTIAEKQLREQEAADPTGLEVNPAYADAVAEALTADLGDGYKAVISRNPRIEKVDFSTRNDIVDIGDDIWEMEFQTQIVKTEGETSTPVGSSDITIQIVKPEERWQNSAWESPPVYVKAVSGFLELQPDFKGEGIGTRYAATSIQNIANLGVKTLTSTAYTTTVGRPFIGAYVWARQGWDWTEGSNVTAIQLALSRWLNMTRDERSGLARTSPTQKGVGRKSIALSKRNGEKLNALLQRVATVIWTTPRSEWPDDLPTPNDIAMFGYKEGDTSWPGKDLLTGKLGGTELSWEATLDLEGLAAQTDAVLPDVPVEALGDVPVEAAPAVVAAVKRPRLNVPGGGFDANGDWHDPGNGKFARRGFSSWKRLAMEAMDAWQVVREDAAHADGPVMARVGTNGLSRGGIKKGEWINIEYVDALHGRVKAATSGRSYNVKWTHFDDVKVLPDTIDTPTNTPDVPNVPEIDLPKPPPQIVRTNEYLPVVTSPVKLTAKVDSLTPEFTPEQSEAFAALLTELTGMRQSANDKYLPMNVRGIAQGYSVREWLDQVFVEPNPDPNKVALIQAWRKALVDHVNEKGGDGVVLHRGILDKDTDPFVPKRTPHWSDQFNDIGRPDPQAEIIGITSWASSKATAKQFGSGNATRDIPVDQLIGRFGSIKGEILVADDPLIGRAIDAWPNDVDGVPSAPFGTFPERWRDGAVGPATTTPAAAITPSESLQNFEEFIATTSFAEWGKTAVEQGAWQKAVDGATASDLIAADPEMGTVFKNGVTLADILVYNASRERLESVELTKENLGIKGFPTVEEIKRLDPEIFAWVQERNKDDFHPATEAFSLFPDRERLSIAMRDPNPDPELVRLLQMHVRAAEFYTAGKPMRLYRGASVWQTRLEQNPDQKGGIASWTTKAHIAESYGPVTEVDVEPNKILSYDTIGMQAELGYPTNSDLDTHRAFPTVPPTGSEVLVAESPEIIDRIKQGITPFKPPYVPLSKPEVEAAIAAGTLKDVNLYGADLSGLDLRGVDLTDIILVTANLRGANLSGVDLTNATLTNADLTGADLSGAKLLYTKLANAKLIGANLTDVDANGTELRGARLENSSLRGANFNNADLTRAKFGSANVSTASFVSADLSRADLAGVDLSEADLTIAKLNYADLSKANLRNTKMGGAKLLGANLNSADLRNANALGANFTEAQLGYAVLSDANLANTNFEKADLRGAKLFRSKLKNSVMNDANLTDAVLEEADLTGVELVKANLTRSDLVDANLSNADLTGANLGDANLSNANLTDTNMTDADLTGANLTGTTLAGDDVAPPSGPGTPEFDEFYDAIVKSFEFDLGEGYSAKIVDKVSVNGPYPTVYGTSPFNGRQEWDITIPVKLLSGDKSVGTAQRSLKIYESGDPASPLRAKAYFTGIGLSPDHQGKGVGTRYSAKSQEQLALAGVESVVTAATSGTAMTDMFGGYVWAREGWDWTEQGSINGMIQVARKWATSNREFRSNWKRDKPSTAISPKSVSLSKNDGKKLIEMLQAAEFHIMNTPRAEWPDDMPTPNDIAMFGYEEGDTSWPGKDLLLGNLGDKGILWTAYRDLTQFKNATPASSALISSQKSSYYADWTPIKGLPTGSDGPLNDFMRLTLATEVGKIAAEGKPIWNPTVPASTSEELALSALETLIFRAEKELSAMRNLDSEQLDRYQSEIPGFRDQFVKYLQGDLPQDPKNPSFVSVALRDGVVIASLFPIMAGRADVIADPRMRTPEGIEIVQEVGDIYNQLLADPKIVALMQRYGNVPPSLDVARGLIWTGLVAKEPTASYANRAINVRTRPGSAPPAVADVLTQLFERDIELSQTSDVNLGGSTVGSLYDHSATLTHEFGHHIQTLINNGFINKDRSIPQTQSALGDVWESAWNRYHADHLSRPNGAPVISKYSHENQYEGFAETFLWVLRRGQNDTSISDYEDYELNPAGQELVDLMEIIINGGAPLDELLAAQPEIAGPPV